MRRFVKDDAGYLEWLVAHPAGYVLNTYAHVTSAYLILHRASCRTINRVLAPGKRWTDPYGKTCSDDRGEIESWALRETGKAVSPCGICRPGGGQARPTPRSARSSAGGGGGRTPRAAEAPIAFDGEPIRIVVPRAGSDTAPRLVIEGAQWLAETFFRRDPSAVGPASYDGWIAHTQRDPRLRDQLSDGDVTAINTTMAARTSHAAWAPVLASPEAVGLRGLDPAWDLFETPDDEVAWATMREPLATVLAALDRPGLGLAVVTKVLHIKRPRLVPVMDSVVVGQVGARINDDVASWVDAIDVVRDVGRLNLSELRGIQAHLRAKGIADRSLVRILDALLWVSSPGSGLFSSLAGWEHVVRPRTD